MVVSVVIAVAVTVALGYEKNKGEFDCCCLSRT